MQTTLGAGARPPEVELTPRRGTQLALTLVAVVVSVGAYALAVIGKTGETPPHLWGFVAAIALAYLLALFLSSRLAPGADPVLYPTAVLLAGFGYAVINRLNPGLAENQFGWIMLGLGLFLITLAMIRDHRVLDSYTYTIGLAGVVLLLLPVVPGLGRTINGARLWVGFGSGDGAFTFQPSEIAKVLLVIFLASYLSSRKELLASATRRLGPFRLPEPKFLAPLLVAWLVSLAVLFMEKDLGSSLLFFAIFVAMVWMATGRSVYLVLGLILFAAGTAIGYAAFAHVQDRVDIWLHALDPKLLSNESYQLAQAQFALATGGIAGTGLGIGHPGLIPLAFTDFIFAAIGEELGLFGTTAILLMYLILVWRGLRAALTREDAFGKLLAGGLTVTLALQTFIIVAGVTRLIPLTGVTLPFVSYGGSSLVANFVILALLIRVSAPTPRHRARRARTALPPTSEAA
jgi:cell division protein FtsW (lipid II flippase)